MNTISSQLPDYYEYFEEGTQYYLRPTIRLLSFYIFEHAQSIKIVGEPDHTVKPYAAVVEELCYEAQRLIPMAEKTAMLYYCYRDKFYNKFEDDLIRSQSVKKQNLAAEYSS